MITIVNLTPHVVVVQPSGENDIVLMPAGPVARVSEVEAKEPDLATTAGQIPLRTVAYAAEILNLPEPTPGVLYLVSRVTAAASDRTDLVFPQGELRDAAGQITGCEALGRFERDRQVHDA